MYNTLNDYIATKTAAAAARKAANIAIAIDGNHELPEACDKKAIHKAFVSLAKSNKNARAVLDDLDGAQIYAAAEAARVEKRALKMKAEHEWLEDAINARLDEILSDDTRRALLIKEAQAAAEVAALASQSRDVADVA